jgi:GNAT superfamily N-acetyltransferase
MEQRLARLTELPDRAFALRVLEEIFFLSTTRTSFADPQERAAFLRTWTGWYVEHAPADIWFALDEGSGILGYLTGCKDSAGAGELARTIPGYEIFADLFAAYPAHLHINVRPEHRGHGIGRRLIEAFAADCAAEKLPGLHLVTAVGARNAAFYRRAGFVKAHPRGRLLFLGRRLAPNDR